MQPFDEGFRQWLHGIVDDRIDAAEVIGCFDNVVYIYRSVFKTDGVGFINVARLVMGQAAAI